MTHLPLPITLPSCLELQGYGRRVAVALALIALGDWLFWGEPIGLSLPAFLTAVAAAVIAANGVRASRTAILGATSLIAASLVPVLESTEPLACAFAVLGLAIFALVVTGQGTPGWARKPLDAALLLLAGPAGILGDVRAAAKSRAAGPSRRLSAADLLGWIVPIGMLGLFAILLTDANPIMESWFAGLDPDLLLRLFDGARMLFWLLLLVAVRPFVAVRLAARPTASATQSPDVTRHDRAWLNEHLLGRRAIARSLLLFNPLFAIQTGLDAIYLWGGATLPAGATYASYAHRGAYPLILTALLAAAFVLVAMRPGGPAEQARPIRPLVYLFVAQNVGLVLSSILRLELYVSVYSLTEWRLAAFAWMGLVLVGLVLIAARIALGRSNRWLVGANVLAMAATLYGSCLVNKADVIASFNLAHQGREAGGGRLDLAYLESLGPGAVPVIDRALAEDGVPWKTDLAAIRKRLVACRRIPRGWRDLDGRTWRLETYLRDHPAAALPASVEPSRGER